MKYKQITKSCAVSACPSIYEQVASCTAMACDSIYQSKQNNDYVIVGKKIENRELSESGLAEKIGEGEAAVQVPKKLIDDLVEKLK